VRCTPLDVCFTSMVISDDLMFLRCSVDFGRTSRPTGFRVEPISAKSMSRGADHTLTGCRCVGSSLFETRPGALFSPRRLLHVDGDFSAFVGGRITSSNTWYRLGHFLACGCWREILHWSGPAVVATSLQRDDCADWGAGGSVEAAPQARTGKSELLRTAWIVPGVFMR